MGRDRENSEPDRIPFCLYDIEREYGPIEQAELKCPGIYHLRAAPPPGRQANIRLYIVTEDAPVTEEARQYGKPVPGHPELCLFVYESPDFHWKVIEYEILRYRTKNKLPLGKFDDLHTAAVYGMEVCPAYFGSYPVPAVTPWGYTARHSTIHNGVYWIETDRCVPALMNAVWARFPEYAAAHTMLEQQGLNDGFGLMLRALSIPGGLHSSLDNMIAMTPGAGVRFLKFL